MERADLERWKAREVARLLALVESERRYYQEITSAIPVGLIAVAADLTIVSANRAVRKIFHLAESPLRSRLDTLLPKSILDRIPEVLRTGAPQTDLVAIDPEKGRWLRVGISPIRSLDDDSEPEALVTIEDLAGLQPGEIPVLKAQSPITNATPAAELAGEQRILAERVQALSALAAKLAHDLNNMLMIVTGHGEEVLNELPAQSPLRADVQEILNAGERISGLTSYLLSFTRRHPAPSDSVDLDAILRGIPPRDGLEVTLARGANLVRADAEELSQFLNAIIEREPRIRIEASNALDADRERALLNISLDARPFDPAGRRAWFEAVLPPKDAARDLTTIVTRFYKAVREWGGDISISPSAAGGTLLSVTLESAGAPSRNTPAKSESTADSRAPLVLVVEDEPGIRALVQKILVKHGYEVLEATNGEEALNVISGQARPIDLLITDVIMPRMGGPELVERLRGQRIDLKVLYLSGYTDDPNIYAAKFPPGTAFLPKPFTLRALVDKVGEVLRA